MAGEHSSFSIVFEDRGETIRYADDDATLYIPHTWCAGSRIFCDGIQSAPGAPRLDAGRREAIIRNLCEYFDSRTQDIVFVLDGQDPDRARLDAFLRDLAAAGHRVRVEPDSAALRETRRDRMYLGILRAGKALNIDGTEIADEAAYRRWKQGSGDR